MNTTTILQRGRLVAYLPSLQRVVKHYRTLSSYNGPRQENSMASAVVDPKTDKPLSQLGPFNPLERMFPMPGRVAPLSSLDTCSAPRLSQPQFQQQGDPMQLLPCSPQEHHERTMKDINTQESAANNDGSPEATHIRLELQALQCTDQMKKEFSPLFPVGVLENRDVTVITLSQKTSNDMSMWNPDVEEERENLLQHFVYGAEDICHTLQDAGFWADFIDPSSGRPYLGDYTNSTLCETDDRFRLLGFKVNDLGCCKVLSHPVWGTYSYVGCIFTDTPVDHPLLQSLLRL